MFVLMQIFAFSSNRKQCKSVEHNVAVSLLLLKLWTVKMQIRLKRRPGILHENICCIMLYRTLKFLHDLMGQYGSMSQIVTVIDKQKNYLHQLHCILCNVEEISGMDIVNVSEILTNFKFIVEIKFYYNNLIYFFNLFM